MLRTVKYILVLSAVLAAVAAASAAWVGAQVGDANFLAIVVAAAVVWICFSAALLVAFFASCSSDNPLASTLGPMAAVHGMLIGVLLRTGLPLIAAVLLSRNEQLASAGVFGLIVVHYLAALVVETPMSLRLIARPTDSQAARLPTGT